MVPRQFLILDFETRSEVDLKAVGGHNYAEHPSTCILCAAWRLGTKETLRSAPVKCWSSTFKNSDTLAELKSHLLSRHVNIVAHNAHFEQVITKYVLARRCPELASIPLERWHCTAAQAAALALPRDLEGACAALKLLVQKDMEGRRLILKYCKPRKPTKNNPAKWHRKASDLRRLMQYCINDVLAETELFLSIPELSPAERETWLLDQKINWRGFLCDRELAVNALDMIARESKNMKWEAQTLTGGKVQTLAQRDKSLAWLKTQGLVIPDLTAKTVADVLKKGGMPEKPTRFLELRQDAAKSSTKKYKAFLSRMSDDWRLRDSLLFHGSSTGRWSGRGVQPQNFPRPKIKNFELGIELINDGDLEWCRAVYAPPMTVLSSCLRPVIRAPEGSKLYGGDFSAIEARVLFWLSGHAAGLQAYHEGRDLYREMASIVFRVALENVTGAQREIGKRIILGCGYGMGHKKFKETCAQFGLDVSAELAEIAVKTYRNVHAPIPKAWNLVEKAAIAAVKNPGTKYTICKTKWSVSGGFLWCELPSGRRLAYCEPTVRQAETPWGEPMPKLYFWSVNPKTKKWENAGTYGGALVENITQATARCIMRDAMFRAENAGYQVVLTVHDEIIAENKKGSINEIESLMSTVPAWAQGCPIAVKGWSGDRYLKG